MQGGMTHLLPSLPYSKDALAPWISAETLEYHHDKHHKAYIEKTNSLVQGTPMAEFSLEELILKHQAQTMINWQVKLLHLVSLRGGNAQAMIGERRDFSRTLARHGNADHALGLGHFHRRTDIRGIA